MECDPTVRFALVMIACPLRSVPVPIDTVPFLNVTVPLGMPEVAGFTVAVNVTGAPKAAGLAEEARLVEVAAPFVGVVTDDSAEFGPSPPMPVADTT